MQCYLKITIFYENYIYIYRIETPGLGQVCIIGVNKYR